MNVHEMHIEFKLSTQQVAANRTRKWYPDEIDWILNKMQERFIRSRLRPKKDGSGGFELDQVNVDDIRGLLRTAVPLDAWVEDADRYRCLLPPDYQYLIQDSSLVDQLCGRPVSSVAKTVYITILQQTQSAKIAPPYYVTVVTNIGGQVVNIPTDLPYGNGYAGYPEKTDISFIVPWMAKRGGWYWEDADTLHVPGSFISITPAVLSIPIATTVDGTLTGAFTQSTLSKLIHTGPSRKIANRLMATNIIGVMNQAAFWKTAYYSPISELVGGALFIYRDNSFTVNGAVVDYIRKPQPISLSLGTDCELPPGTHQAICDLATEFVKGTVGDIPGLQVKTADIASRVTI